MTFIFRNMTIFWDISKYNRRQKKWDGGSINFPSKKTASYLLNDFILSIFIYYLIMHYLKPSTVQPLQ